MAINPAWPGFWELNAIQTGSKQSVFLPKVSSVQHRLSARDFGVGSPLVSRSMLGASYRPSVCL